MPSGSSGSWGNRGQEDALRCVAKRRIRQGRGVVFLPVSPGHLKPEVHSTSIEKLPVSRDFQGVILGELRILRPLKCTQTQTMIAFLQMISLWEWLGHVKSMRGLLGIVIVSLFLGAGPN